MHSVNFKFAMMLVLAGISISGCRSIWQKPDEVMEAIALNENDIIADIGAGRGYFSYRFADLENSGRVYAIEINEKLLKRMQKKADARYSGKLVPVLGSYEDPNIPEKVDVIFLCNTYHHIENRVNYFSNLEKYLNKNGRIVIVEPDNLPWYLFTLRNHQTPATKVIDELARAGYKLIDEHDFLPVQNLLIFGIAN